MPPLQHQFAFGEQEKLKGALNPASKGDVRARWWNCAPKAHARLMRSARGHCRGEESIASPPIIPVARDAHDLPDASKPQRIKLRWQFDPQVWIRGAQSHGSQKNHQHDFDFLFDFPWFFRSRRIFLFPLSALRLQLDVVLVDPRFVTCDDPFQEFIAFLWDFPVNATLPVATFAQDWAVSVQSWRKPFSFPNVPSKSCERTTFPNQVLLLSF